MIIRSPQRKSPEDCLFLPSEISISAHVTAAGPLTSTSAPPTNPCCSHFNSFLAKLFNQTCWKKAVLCSGCCVFPPFPFLSQQPHTRAFRKYTRCGHHSSSPRCGGQDDKSIILSSIRLSQTNIHPCSDSHCLLPFASTSLRHCMRCCSNTENVSIPASTLQLN